MPIKSLFGFILVLIGSLAIGCQSWLDRSSPTLNVTIDPSKTLAIPITNTLSEVGDFEVFTVLSSAFKSSPGSSFQEWRTQRRNTFVNLFEDQIEPYTGRLIRKYQCLVMTFDQGVIFHSGKGRDWAGCQAVESKLLFYSYRTWVNCETHWVELTLISRSQTKLSPFPEVKCVK